MRVNTKILRGMLFVLHEVTNATNTRETESAREKASEKLFVEKEKGAREIFSFSENGRLFSRELHSLVCSYLIGEHRRKEISADINGDKEAEKRQGR